MNITEEHGLYKFYWDCGRMGSVDGLFFAHKDEVEKAMGSYIYFGEILGKHSEIYGTLAEDALERLNIEAPALQQLHDVCGSTISGYNPLHYIHCNDCKCCQEDCSCE